jgi:hypothetical protein
VTLYHVDLAHVGYIERQLIVFAQGFQDFDFEKPQFPIGIIAVAYVLLFIFVTLQKMTYTWLAATDSPYPFAIEEMQRFNVPAKLSRRRR